MTIGMSIPYIDGDERVTGRIDYTLNMSVPGMLHAHLLRSPYPHARIVRVDASAAEAVPGVAAVLTGADLRNNPELNAVFGPVLRDQPVVAFDKVRFVGDPVAAVAAVDKDTAEYAAGLIEVEYEELPAAVSIAEAIAPGAPLVHETIDARQHSFADIILHEEPGTNYCNHFNLIKGDAEAGMAAADYIFEDTFSTPAAQHVPLETHACVAVVQDRQVSVWTGTQTPHIVRAQLAELFNLPENRVRVQVPTLGGGYGAKTYPKIEPITAALAWKARRPVKLVLSRAEEFVTITKHECIVKMRTGVKKNGEIVAKQVEAWWNAGAYADISPRLIKNGGYASPGPYRIPNVRVVSHAVYTNRPPAGAFRGYGVAQVAWATENQMDIIAEKLGLDPVEFRLKNLLRAGEKYATGEVLEEVDFHGLLEHSARQIGWEERRPGPDPATKARGKGIAVIIKGTVTPSTSNAILRLHGDGSCSVLTSTVEMGQGSNTVLTQIAAEALTLPYEAVTIVRPDTDVTPYDLTTSSSRSTYSMGQAILAAAADLKRQATAHAARLLEADPEQLEVRDGGVYFKDGHEERGQGLAFGQLIRRAGCGNLMAGGTFQTKGGLDPRTGQGIASVHWHQASAAAEVEVDRETGHVKLLAIHAAQYTGRTVNPINVELQTEGNIIFGIGKAMLEEMLYDNGQLVNASLADYMIPSLEDLPERLTTSLHQNPDTASDPHGVGETALPPIAPAISNAIYNAVGVRVHSLPITPEKVLRSIKEGPQRVALPVEAGETAKEPA